MRNNALREVVLPELSGGLNVNDPEYRIEDNQSPDMLNLWYKDMALCKRPGQMRLSKRGTVWRVSEPYNGARVMHVGTKLVCWSAEGMQRNFGGFSPGAGFPALSAQEYDGKARPGDYCVASSAGAVRGVAYEAGDTAICCWDGVQRVTMRVSGAVAAEAESPMAAVTVTGAALAVTVTLSVALAAGDGAAVAAGKIRAALAEDETVAAAYTAGGAYRTVTLSREGAADLTLEMTLDCAGCEGLVGAASYDDSVWRPVAREIFSGVAEGAGAFCEFGDTLYYLDGSEIWEIAPDHTVTAVEPYAPVVLINAAPDLSAGDDNEAYNLIGPGFTVWYNGTGSEAVRYYVTVQDDNTFGISSLKGGTAMKFTSAGTEGWRVRAAGGDWKTGASANEDTGVITLAAHGFEADAALEFDAGTGELPGGVKAYDVNIRTVYHLPLDGLDDAEVRVSVDAADLAENTGFTVDRAAGTVDFTAGTEPHGAPSKGTSNVWITAFKTVEGSKQRIAGCRAAVRFGGEAAGVVGGTRVFVTANPNYPYRYWRSDLGLNVSFGMRYFPDTSEERLDQNSEAITAAAKMGDELILFKESSIFAVGYSFDGEDVYYPVRECHNAIGCDVPDSVQLIDNRLVFAHTKGGVYMLVGTGNALENIVKPISANVNALLLKEDNLAEACSVDHDRRYWLCAGGHAYVWDYDSTPYYNYADYDKAQRRLAWYRFDNIGAGCFFEEDGLCHGGAAGVARFTRIRNDFGEPIRAYWRSKAFDMGRPDEEKSFLYLYPSFSPDGNLCATVSAGNERTEEWTHRLVDSRTFDWREFFWNAFTWECIKFSRTFEMRLRMRRSVFLQVAVEGNEADKGVGLSGLRFSYSVNKKRKG